LNQELNVQEWDQKDAVKEQALNALKKVMSFKQVQFDAQRQTFKEALDQQKSIENIESQKEGVQASNAGSMKQMSSNDQMASPSKEIINQDSGVLPEA